VVVNPNSPFHKYIVESLTIGYKDTLFPLDAIMLEKNSREFAPRIAKMNDNALKLAAFLHGHPVIERTYFPPNDPSSKWNYDECIRTGGGYSYLLTIQFKQRKSAIRFFDVVRFEKGPSLGTEFTLASPYVLLTFPRELEWVSFIYSQERLG
jgi:cystathionine gamma-synthase